MAAKYNNKNQKETGKENKNKNIVDTIPSDNTHSANNSSSESDKSKNADNSNSNSNSNVNNNADNHNSIKSDTENTERSSSDNKNNMQIHKYGLKIINEKVEDSVKITTIDSELKDFILKVFEFYNELTPLVIKLKSKDIDTKRKHNDIFKFWKEFGKIIDSKSLLNEIFKKEDEKAALLEYNKEYESKTRSKVLELIKQI